MSNTTTNMPLIEVPFVDQNGNISQTWFMFLVQLFRRTGGTIGSNTLTVGDVLALEETFAPIPVGASVHGALADMVVAAATNGRTTGRQIDVVMPPVAREGHHESEMVFAPICAQLFTQTFASGTDFTPGTTATLKLSRSFSAVQSLLVFFDSAYQGDDQYQLAGNTLTFGAAIPVGVNKVYVKGVT